MARRWLRLSHGWRLQQSEAARDIVAEWIRPAVRAIPATMADRLPRCEITLVHHLSGSVSSPWTMAGASFEIAVESDGVDPHDLVLETLVCVGQALWEVIRCGECARWLLLLNTEIEEQVIGEIDAQALADKRQLLSSLASARSPRHLTEYARSSFAGTVAEYVHSLWHDVTVRTGPGHLLPHSLRIRFQLMEQWFPPNRGYRLFPAQSK